MGGREATIVVRVAAPPAAAVVVVVDIAEGERSRLTGRRGDGSLVSET